jgi:hypothetical protein
MRKDNPEKTVGAHKKGQSRRNRRGTQGYSFLWIVCPCVPLQLSLDCPPLCDPTVFSGLFTLVCPYGFSGLSFLVCPYSFFWVVLSHVPQRFSLDCPPLCAPTVFSGLSAIVFPYGHTRADNPEKTVGAHKGGQSRENHRGT